MVNIRAAESRDRESIRDLHMQAFPQSENKIVARLALELMREESVPDTLSLVAEGGGEVLGHIAFSPLSVDEDKSWLGYLLGPLAVRPEHQDRGIGTQLVKAGMEQLSRQGVHVVIVYGDPEYYTRFGFEADVAERYLPPYKLQYPFGWLAKVLHEGASDSTEVVPISCVAPLCNPALW
jgi:putative acetyltransferase